MQPGDAKRLYDTTTDSIDLWGKMPFRTPAFFDQRTATLETARHWLMSAIHYFTERSRRDTR